MEDENQKTHNELWEAIELVRNNHIEHLKQDVNEIKVSLASHSLSINDIKTTLAINTKAVSDNGAVGISNSTDLEWLKKAMGIVAVASTGAFFTAVFNLLTK